MTAKWSWPCSTVPEFRRPIPRHPEAAAVRDEPSSLIDESKWCSAVHEAAHATAALAISAPIYAIEVYDGGGGRYLPRSDSKLMTPTELRGGDPFAALRQLGPSELVGDWVQDQLMLTLAGGEAGRRTPAGRGLAGSDREDVDQLIGVFADCAANAKFAFDLAAARTTQLVDTNWAAICTIAGDLYRHGRLLGDEVAAAARRTPDGRRLLAAWHPPC